MKTIKDIKHSTFATLAHALRAEGIFDVWPTNSRLQRRETKSHTIMLSNGNARYMRVSRHDDGFYSRPITYVYDPNGDDEILHKRYL